MAPEARLELRTRAVLAVSLAAGVSLRACQKSDSSEAVPFTLARRMGTSLEMIDRMYGHLAPDAEELELGILNAYDARKPEAVAK